MPAINDYTQSFAAKPRRLTLEQAAYITPPMQLSDTEAVLDIPRMRSYRLQRIREQLVLHEYAAVLLTDPLSIRYACGVRNCALFQTHIHAGYLFIPAHGPVIYFDSEPGRNTAAQLETVDEIRDDVLPISYMFGGSRHAHWCRQWARQIADLVSLHCAGNRRLALEKAGTEASLAFHAESLEIFEAASVMAMARKIKCPEEILCMNQTIAIAEDGMTRMRDALRNGMTEVEIWSHMWQANIEGNGEWIEYRLLASGERTNPWQQEAGSRMIRAGDLLCFDCGMIGPFGYGADISRAFHCGPGSPSEPQKLLYTQAWREVTHNTQLMRSGADFNDIVAERYVQPEAIGKQPYPCLAHGLGMGDEWPVIYYPRDRKHHFDGQLETGMVICVESYVGEIGGLEGVKLENQVLITDSGPITLSRYPFEENLLNPV